MSTSLSPSVKYGITVLWGLIPGKAEGILRTAEENGDLELNEIGRKIQYYRNGCYAGVVTAVISIVAYFFGNPLWVGAACLSSGITAFSGYRFNEVIEIVYEQAEMNRAFNEMNRFVKMYSQPQLATGDKPN